MNLKSVFSKTFLSTASPTEFDALENATRLTEGEFKSTYLESGTGSIDTVPLFDLQRFVGTSKLFESQLNRILRSLGLPEIAGYLALTYAEDLDPNILPHYELDKLITAIIHSRLLDRSVFEVLDGAFAVDHPHVTAMDDVMFERFRCLLTDRFLPLIRNRNFSSIALTLTNKVIKNYQAFDCKTKLLLETLVDDASKTGLIFEDLYNRKSMAGKEMEHQDSDSEELGSSIKRFLESLRSKKHLLHPTKFEIILKIFEANDFEPVDVTQLGSQVFGDNDDAERSVQMKISRLNSKLEGYGLQIERSNKYQLNKVKHGKKNPE